MAIKETVNTASGYTPKIFPLDIRITDELPPLHLIYGKTSYSIVCTNLKVKGRDPKEGPRGMGADIYYSNTVSMDETARKQIMDYLEPILPLFEDIEWYEEKEPAYQQIRQRFGEEAASNLGCLYSQIQRQVIEWYEEDQARAVLCEPVAYICSDYEELCHELPYRTRQEAYGMRMALLHSGLKSEYFPMAAYYAGYLKGSREAGGPIPQLLRNPRQVLLDNNIFL